MDREKRFHALMSVYGASEEGIAGAWTRLVDAYSCGDRVYHTLDHVEAVLEELGTLKLEDPFSVELAAWYHDAVYDTHREDNEQASAEFARAELSGLGIREDTIDVVRRLIRTTADHVPDEGLEDSPKFLDADLAILAADRPVYQAYAEAIRQEYAWVSDEDYCDARSEILSRFLKRDSIFHSLDMWSSHEKTARGNLRWEIRRLLAN
jgi:predicted metal-dependent HD superfamily phosphohydrolase